MAINLGNAVLYFIGNLTGLDKALDQAQGKVQSASQKIAGTMNSWGNKLTLGLTARLTGLGLKALDAASDLEETVNKSAVVFGAAQDKVVAFGDAAARSIGMSKNASISAAATYGNLFTTMGVGVDQSAELSLSLVKLAGDLASFHNIKPEEALEKLRSGLIGEAEPLRSVGVLLTEAAVKEKALEMGLWDGTGAISERAKVMARYQIIMEQTKTAQGDFARTSNSLANQLRTWDAQTGDAFAKLGESLKPIARTLVGFLIDVTEWFNKLSPATQEWIVKILALAWALGPVLKIAAGIVTLFGSGGALAGVGTFFTATLIPAVTAAGGAIVAFLLSPIGMLIAALAGLAIVLKVFGPEAWQSLSQIGQIVGAAVRAAWGNYQLLNDQVGQIMAALKRRFAQAAVEWTAAIVQPFVNAKNAIAAGAVEIVAAVAAKFGAFRQAAAEAVRGVQETFNRLTTYFSDLYNRLSAFVRRFVEVGKGIVTGIWNGIQSGWNWLKNMIGQNLDNLLQWVKDKLLIHSPSALYREQVGKPVGQGVGLGITGGIQEAIQSMGRSFGQVPALNPLLAAAGGGRSVAVGRIEYHGAFSQDELERLDRRNARATANLLLAAFEEGA